MEPISAAASIVGLVGAAAKVSESLFKFIRSVKEAPKLASTVLQEVSDISACLSQLQNFLMGTEAASRSHENLLMVEQIIVALSNCVLIFSELEEIVESLKPSVPMQLGILSQWILKEQNIRALFTRLQSSKVSLNLMMTTLTCTSVGEAQASVSELATLVTQVLESNQEMSRRMAKIEQWTFGQLPSSFSTLNGRDAFPSPSVVRTNTTEDNESVVAIKGLVSDSQNGTNGVPIRTFSFSFDQDLKTSRPYTQAMKRHTVWSAASSEIHTMGWSCLSGLSLAEVSQISVINLPVFRQDLWNGQHYSASRFEDFRVGLVLSKSLSNSTSSLKIQQAPTQPAPTFKRRLNIRNPIRASQRSGSLSTIKEDTCAPVTARKISLLGYGDLIGPSLSGKTTIFNHLQMLYGNGITKLERIVAFEVILGNLIQIFTEAWSIWSDQYSHENDKEGRKVKASYHSVQTLVHAAKTDHLSNELFGGSCYQSLRHLWNNRGLRDTILSWNNPMFNENVPYYMENLEKLFTPDQIVSDSHFLRLNRRSLGCNTQDIYIDHMKYQILDLSGRCKVNHWHCLSDFDFLIFVVSLTSYFQAPPNDMTSSLKMFATLTKNESLTSTPFIILLNKFDLFEEKMTLEPIRDYFPTYSGSSDPSLACSYFAGEFLKLDERLKASVRIYRTSAVDLDSFKATMDSIAQNMPQRRSEGSTEGPENSSSTMLFAPTPPQTDMGWIDDIAVKNDRHYGKISAPIMVSTTVPFMNT